MLALIKYETIHAWLSSITYKSTDFQDFMEKISRQSEYRTWLISEFKSGRIDMRKFRYELMLSLQHTMKLHEKNGIDFRGRSVIK